jgi:Mg-chelatase subunit ChlD
MATNNKSNSAKTTSVKTSPTKNAHPEQDTVVHFCVLLDRSGSMSSMVDDVIGGFNGFLAEQRRLPGRAKITLVQFDSQEHHAVVVDAKPLEDATELTDETFVPRGGTPLLDATAELIGRMAVREQSRAALGKAPEEVVFVTITDGDENSSYLHTLAEVKSLIEARTAAGWTFVFLGAGLDAYSDAAQYGYSAGATQSWAADGKGALKVFGSVSRAAAMLRSDVASGVEIDKSDYFRGRKEAEDDKKARGK